MELNWMLNDVDSLVRKCKKEKERTQDPWFWSEESWSDVVDRCGKDEWQQVTVGKTWWTVIDDELWDKFCAHCSPITF